MGGTDRLTKFIKNELFIDSQMLIPTYQTTELTSLHVSQSPTDNLREKDTTKEIN